MIKDQTLNKLHGGRRLIDVQEVELLSLLSQALDLIITRAPDISLQYQTEEE